MHRIRNAHEAPLSLAGDIEDITDYDYALVHMFDSPNIGERYFNFFKTQIGRGREVFLDNSIFELGESFSPGKFATYVETLRPTVYIVPDVLEDGPGTIESFAKFIHDHPDLPGVKMGVVQGRDMEEVIECYRYMAEHADYIAFSYDSALYSKPDMWTTDMPFGKNHQRAAGRFGIIRGLFAEGIIVTTKPHHLLGSSLDSEMKLHIDGGHFFIRSVDTSNPVWAGLNDLVCSKYLDGWGMVSDKPYDSSQILMCDHIEEDLQVDVDTFHATRSAIKTFRGMCK
mgnify:CR=1 FL=1|tara:strand:- start:11893 stop:12744 length:852 start_codon:yes stop_codon:yes gene_type:complete